MKRNFKCKLKDNLLIIVYNQQFKNIGLYLNLTQFKILDIVILPCHTGPQHQE